MYQDYSTIMFNCVICGGEEHKKLLEMEKFQLWRCQKCSVVKTIGKFDDGQYDKESELEAQFKYQKRLFEDYAKRIAKLFPVKKGKFLDVGCGLGWLVHLAGRMGFKAQGIDTGKAAISVGRRLLNVDTKLISLEKYKPGYKFDLISANHVIEHCDDPVKFVRGIKKNLNKNGWVLISCPNFDSLMLWIFQQRWYGLVPNQHRFQFSGKSLRYLFEKEGFKVEKIIVNNLDYRAEGWKGIIFRCLLEIARLTNTGDQVTILARI